MTDIILIETSAALCSTALSRDGKVISSRESDIPHSHASKTAPFIKEMLDEQGIGVHDCQAVCVSRGPGSYTGLRVGTSTAKGLCFGAGIPLVSIGTLDILVRQAQEEGLVPEGCKHVVPVIDARRMEIYCAVFSPEGRQLTPTAPVILESGSFNDILSEGPVLFIGDAAEKCKGVISAENAFFATCCPKAASMASLAQAAFDEGKFEDTAYFEPFYLKDFIATKPKKNLF